MKRVLIISPHFPPVNAPDMQRVRLSLPHFLAAGWDVTVLTVDDPTPTAPVEAELLQTIPAEVRVERAICLPRSWTRWIGVGNVALRALPFLFTRGCSLLRRHRPDVVYFSTTQFIVLPFGRLWRSLFQVPYVVDLQDPWVTDHYERSGAAPPGGWKYRLVSALARRLEAWSLRRASHLIVVSVAYATDLTRRHASLTNLPATEIPFGPAESDLAAIRSTPAPAHATRLPPGPCRLVFVGAISQPMLPVVNQLFVGLAAAQRAGLDFSVHFYGTTYSATATPVLAGLIAQHGLSQIITESPARLGYLDSLRLNLEAEINLVLGSTDTAFTPSKLLTLAAIDRPLLALAPEGSALQQRLRLLRRPCLTLGPDFERAVGEFLRDARSPRIPRATPLPANFTQEASAAAQLAILGAVSTHRDERR